MNNERVLVVDVGTSGIRVGVYDAAGAETKAQSATRLRNADVPAQPKVRAQGEE